MWSRTGSNRRPPECHSGALPTELRPQYTILLCILKKSSGIYNYTRQKQWDLNNKESVIELKNI